MTCEIRADQLGADDFICLPIPQADGTIKMAETEPFDDLKGKDVVVTGYDHASPFVKTKINELIQRNIAKSVLVK